jgi:protein-tyrosine phosphatase
MIDLHCHILPGIDDGARDVDDAVAMAAQAEADGITAICATPHIRHDHDVRIGEIADRVAGLNDELARSGIGVRILPGGEVAETALDGLDPDELASVGLGGSRWLLLEPAPGPLSDSLVGALHHLHERGFRALIAHPERHPGPEAERVLAALVADGALVQGTAAYVEGGDDSPLYPLASRGLVHVLGSDSHSSLAGRPVRLSTGLAALGAIPTLRAHSRWISEEAPAAIVSGGDVVVPFAPT